MLRIRLGILVTHPFSKHRLLYKLKGWVNEPLHATADQQSSATNSLRVVHDNKLDKW